MLPMIECRMNGGEHIDRMSELPTNVIDGILQHLSIHDLVKTSTLSRKWRYMWTSISTLKFTRKFFEKCKRLQMNLDISSIITELLLVHNGPLRQFIVHFPSNYPIKMQSLSKWILFLSRKGVNKITLLYPETNTSRTPSTIFSCQELTYLQLKYSRLSKVSNFAGFKSLVTLRLSEVRFESGALECLMSGCSLLVELTIYYCSGFERINVSSPVLKILYIVKEEVIKSVYLKQPQKLIELTLWADKGRNDIEKGWLPNLMKDLPEIEWLDLGGGYIEILSTINSPVLVSTADNLTHLKLSGVNFKKGELLLIISLLENSPNLEDFDIEVDSSDVEPQMISKVFECISCCFNRLQIVNVTVKTSVYEHALEFVRFVLAKSFSLKILTFKVGLGINQSDAPILLSISRDMLQMKRASPTAEVKFLYYGHTE